MKIIQVTDLPLELGFVLPVALDFLQASTLTHVCAKSNLWTSAGSTGCPSCTTCAPQSAPLPAALTHRAMRRSLRTRAACPLTVCREFFWDSPAWKSLWPSLALSVCNCVQHIYKLLSDFYTHTHSFDSGCMQRTKCETAVLSPMALKTCIWKGIHSLAHHTLFHRTGVLEHLYSPRSHTIMVQVLVLWLSRRGQ